MFKKIFLYSLITNFFFTKKIFAAESGGMPQLDPEFWISQIFWLVLTFGVLYIVLSKLILPKISANLELRESSEAKLKEFDGIILKSKIEAKNIFKDAREKVIKNINSKKEILDKQIDDEIKKAEVEIDTLRQSAPEKINKIAVVTSTEILKKLIGAEVNNSSISAIVDDLVKKNGDKYYGH